MEVNGMPTTKRAKPGKTGYNINNLIDIGNVANQFVNHYYYCVSENNIQELIEGKILRDYTSIKFNENKLKGAEIISFISNFSRYKINVNTFNYVDSGSRRIDISVIGTLSNTSENINFNQTFIICNQDDSWFIKNSIFLTF